MANGTFDITQTDAQLQAILNKIQPLMRNFRPSLTRFSRW